MNKALFVDIKPRQIYGGSLKPSLLRDFLQGSYKKSSDIKGFTLDHDLSGKRVQVYKSVTGDQVVVVHRGSYSLHDWVTNANMFMGGTRALKMSARYKHAKEIQKQAEEKYGASNVTTVGHSLGAKIAQEVGGNSKEVLTVNKPTLPGEVFFGYNEDGDAEEKQQFDIRSSRDIVSSLAPLLERPHIENTTITAKSWNPLVEHSVEIVDRLDQDKAIGRGIKRNKSIRSTINVKLK